MKLAASTLAIAALFSATSCSNSSSGGSAAETVPVGISARALKVVIPAHTIEPGDQFECYYTDLTTDRELYANSATGEQGRGGHHISLYYTVNPQPVGHHKCIDAEMAEWRQVGAAGGDTKGDGVIDLPPGIAVKIPAGRQIVLQTHYINASATPYEAADEITVKLLAREEVKRFAQAFSVVDGTFEIPPSAKYSRTTSCTLKRDFDILMILGHMHEFGRHYTLEHLDAKGGLIRKMIDDDWEPAFTSHPPTRRFTAESPYKLKAGEKLRQTCTWNNVASEKVLFPREMCIAFSMYLDDDGFLECAAEEEKRPE